MPRCNRPDVAAAEYPASRRVRTFLPIESTPRGPLPWHPPRFIGWAGQKGCQKMWWKSLCHPNLAGLPTGIEIMDCNERERCPNLSLHAKSSHPSLTRGSLPTIPTGQSSPSKACKAVSSIRWSTWAYRTSSTQMPILRRYCILTAQRQRMQRVAQ